MKISNLIIFTAVVALTTNFVQAKDSKDKGKPVPRGLQKKLDRGKQLPPGWQKKLVVGEVMPQDIYQQSVVAIPLDSDGMLSVRVEGKLIRLYEATREVVHILDMLN